MKYLTDYFNDDLTALHEELGVFFAFSQKQMDEQKKEGVEYCHLGAGTICPKENAKEYLTRFQDLIENAIKQDLEENGKDAIIDRELANHECWYTGDIQDCVDKLEDYPGITVEDIVERFHAGREAWEACNA